MAGCAMIWRSRWTHRAATPVAGYTLIGFFGPVVSLIISIGMANVAGATKKSCTAAAIFVAYCVGNVRIAPGPCHLGSTHLTLKLDNRAAADKDADAEEALS